MADVWSMPAWRAFELFTPYPLGHVVPASPGCSGAASCTVRACFPFTTRSIRPGNHAVGDLRAGGARALLVAVARARAARLRGALATTFPSGTWCADCLLSRRFVFPRSSHCCFAFPGHAGSVWIRLRGVGPARARLWMKRALLKFVALVCSRPVPCGLRANTCPPISRGADPARLFARVAGGAGFAVAAVVGATPGTRAARACHMRGAGGRLIAVGRAWCPPQLWHL